MTQLRHPDFSKYTTANKSPIRVPHGVAMSIKKNRRMAIADESCAMCGYSFWPTLHIHHIKPVCKGGTDHSDNLVLLCPNCHQLIHHFCNQWDRYCSIRGNNPRCVDYDLRYIARELKINEDIFITLLSGEGEKWGVGE